MKCSVKYGKCNVYVPGDVDVVRRACAVFYETRSWMFVVPGILLCV
jgi:hypothetical protein